MNTKALVWEEDGMYIIREVVTGVTTQGRTLGEATANIKEAVCLYLEEMPEAKKLLGKAIKTVAISV